MIKALALVFFLLQLSDAEQTVDLFFSGGGIRATFGSFIVACEIQKYHNNGTNHFEVENMYGLSGGSWGVTMMTSSTRNPCEMVAQAKKLAEFGKISEYSPKTCGSYDGISLNSCYNGWVLDITRWYRQMGITTVVSQKEGLVFGKKVFGNAIVVRSVILTDMCTFNPSGNHHSYHDGVCLVQNDHEPQVECAKDLNSTRTNIPVTFEADLKSKVEQRGLSEITYRDMDILDWAAFSSAAWAEAAKVIDKKTKGYLPLFDHRTPYVNMDTDVDKKRQKSTSQTKKDQDSHVKTQFCDAGGDCNIPLSALDVLYRVYNPKQKTYVAFDYSDNEGDQMVAMAECFEKWEQKIGWKLIKYKWFPWGPSFLLHPKDTDLGNNLIMLHVVLFRGGTLGDQLVKKFPTVLMTWTHPFWPNWFIPETATTIETEYGKFLREELFNSKNNPFNTDTAAWIALMEQEGRPDFKADEWRDTGWPIDAEEGEKAVPEEGRAAVVKLLEAERDAPAKAEQVAASVNDEDERLLKTNQKTLRDRLSLAK